MFPIAYENISGDLEKTAKKLAEKYHLKKVDLDTKDYPYILVLTPKHLELRATNTRYKPFYIDFLTGKHASREKQIQHELIIKAIGVKPNIKPTVLDLTAGIGKDAFLLATAGCHVTMLERSQVLYLLLMDALTRLNTIKPLHWNLFYEDAFEYLKRLNEKDYPEVVYFDPMFPERTKSALVKKEMRILHDLVGSDDDAAALFHLALRCAKKRVVVKRPRLAKPMGDLKPSFEFVGRSTRFDVYVCSCRVD